MSSPSQKLDLLRQDIDAIDAAIHALIIKRGTIVEDIRKIKPSDAPALRPGREATVLRRLAATHAGSFPLKGVILIWREMMAGFTQMQSPLTAGVYAQDGRDRLIAIARDHYGGLTPITALPGCSTCVRAVAEGAIHLAVLPLPADDEAESWWIALMGEGGIGPRIVSRLPFVDRPGADQALVVSTMQRDPSDSELSLLVLHLRERASRSRVLQGLRDSGFASPHALASREVEPTSCFHLVEIPGSIDRADPRLLALPIEFGSSFVDARCIGGYAKPIILQDH